MAKQIDTVTVEVVRNLLMSIAEETYGIDPASKQRGGRSGGASMGFGI